MSVNVLPSLFVSHGAPDLLLSGHAATQFLARLGEALTPQRVIVVSAHWSSAPVAVTGSARPEFIYDFHGFPAALYDTAYPVAGAPALALQVQETLTRAGIAARVDERRGLDHGAWVPLKLIYPRAEIPVVQVALPQGGMDELVRFGAALGTLRDADTLLLCSGGTVHNLRALDPSGATAPWAQRFEEWLRRTVEVDGFDALRDHARLPPEFAMAHPTFEHFAPLVVAWAAGDPRQVGVRMFAGFDYGNLGMSCYAFPAAGAPRL